MDEINALRNDFYRAYSGISFSPEKRAESSVQEFSAQLSADLLELGGNSDEYKRKYIDYLRRWAARRAQCLSPMITGAANFPVARNEKAFRAERKAWEEFQAWRERYIKRANRVPVKSPEEEIDDALLKLEKERNAHEIMVGINKILRKKLSDEEKRKMIVDEYELKDEEITEVMTQDWAGRVGYPSFKLTNSNARIKNLEAKVITMKNRIFNRDNFEPITFEGGIIDIKADRVIIKHDEKPLPEVIKKLKACGFHWTNTYKCWCRKHTAMALRAAKELCGVDK